MATSIATRVALRDGHSIPLFGLGFWKTPQEKVKGAIDAALECGYQLFDTAIMYGNEREVGQNLRLLPRKDFYVVTKLVPTVFTNQEVRDALKSSLKKMGLDYVDLFLIHTPRHGGKRLFDVWKAFIELKEEGLTKSIGVSNFNVDCLEAFRNEGLEVPAVNQIEIHPWNIFTETIDYCKQNNIAVMGYCPLARWKFDTTPLSSFSTKYSKTTAQILLRWAVQHGFITIPKSANPERIKENSDIFSWSITPEDMAAINSLNANLLCSTACGVMNESFLAETKFDSGLMNTK